MTTTELIGQVALMTAIVTSGAAVGGSLFEILVNEVNLTKGLPDSIMHVRQFYKYRNPGDFYKFVTPLLVLSIGVALFSFWENRYGRVPFLFGALAAYSLTQSITLIYFFPQNHIIREGSPADVNKLLSGASGLRTLLDVSRTLLAIIACGLLMLALSQPWPR